MNFDREMAILIQRYLIEVKFTDLTLKEVLSRPRYRRVWYYWKAKEHYEGKEIPMSLEACKAVYGD